MHLTEGQFLTAEVAPVEELRGQEAEASSLMRIVGGSLKALYDKPNGPIVQGGEIKALVSLEMCAE